VLLDTSLLSSSSNSKYLTKRKLLDSGYNVNGTVRSLKDEKKIQHLHQTVSNETQKGKLTLFEADLLEEGSFQKTFEGVIGVFHVASPFFLYKTENPQKDLVDPAVNGTKNVINEAFKSKTVERVVVTSSTASVIGNRESGHIYTDKDFNDTVTIETQPYMFSKVTAEIAAWDLVKELTKELGDRKFDLVVVNPAFVLGPPLSSRDDSTSVAMIKAFLSGTAKETTRKQSFGIVDVRDVVNAHFEAMKNPEANGRYLVCHAEEFPIPDLIAILAKNFPKYPVTTTVVDDAVPKLIYDVKKTIDLIGELVPIEKTIVDMGNAMIDLGIVEKQ
jgi:nucleoside-diphosphate-sugar epimerase